MAKRGPKKKPGKRFKNNRLDYRAVVVRPAAELVAKRIARFVIAGVPPDKDLRLAESWIGVLFAAGVINQAQYDAGNNYHAIYKTLYPQGFPGSALDIDMIIDGQPFEPISDSGVEDIDLAWRASERILKALDRRTHAIVKNICVFGRFEQFIDVSSPRPKEAWRADAQNRTRFKCGLDALALAYGFKRRPVEKNAEPLSATA